MPWSPARIAGAVDLSGLGAVDAPPPGALEDCSGGTPDEGLAGLAREAVLTRLDLSRSTLSALTAPDLRLAFGLRLVRRRVQHGIVLTDARIGTGPDAGGAMLTAREGGAALSAAALAPNPGEAERLTLSLRKTRIGDRLLVRGLDGASSGVVDLSGAHAAVLDDIATGNRELGWRPSEKGRPPRDARTGELSGVQLRLHGFTYDMLATPEGRQHDSNDFWLARRAWLRRQARRHMTQRDYSPQPHEQLVKVLRASGYPAEADRVARDKRNFRLARGVERPIARPWHWFVRFAFAHNYSTWRAIMTLVLYVLPGASGQCWRMSAPSRWMRMATDRPPLSRPLRPTRSGHAPAGRNLPAARRPVGSRRLVMQQIRWFLRSTSGSRQPAGSLRTLPEPRGGSLAAFSTPSVASFWWRWRL